jgi:prophage antirepressor-like protein
LTYHNHNHPVRTLQHTDGTTWWVAADVCAVLDIRNVSHACARLKDHEKDIVSNDTPGGDQDILIVSEPGLYRLIMGSRKKEAEAFQHWVFHEVLPQIRKTGAYGQPAQPVVQNQALQAIINMAVQLDRTEQRAIIAETTAIRAEDKADMALAEVRMMTFEDFVMANGLLRQLPQQHWPGYAQWLKAFCQSHGLSIRKDPVPGRPWEGENVYPVTALGALLRHEQTRPRQVALLQPSRSGA